MLINYSHYANPPLAPGGSRGMLYAARRGTGEIPAFLETTGKAVKHGGERGEIFKFVCRVALPCKFTDLQQLKMPKRSSVFDEDVTNDNFS